MKLKRYLSMALAVVLILCSFGTEGNAQETIPEINDGEEMTTEDFDVISYDEYVSISIQPPSNLTLGHSDSRNVSVQAVYFSNGRQYVVPTSCYQWYYRMSSADRWSIPEIKKTPGYTRDYQEKLYLEGGTGKTQQVQWMCRVSYNGYVAETHILYVTLAHLPAISSQPSDLEVKLGEIASFTVKAYDSIYPESELKYQWYRSVNGYTFTEMSGETSSALRFKAAYVDDQTWYYCKITNPDHNSIQTREASLTIADYEAPRISRQPRDLTVINGEACTISIDAAGTALKYQWYYRLPGSSSFVKWSGRTEPSFQYTGKDSQNGMQFYCVITNPQGVTLTSETATLTVRKGPVTIVKEAQDAAVYENETAVFEIQAYGEGLQYQWYYRSGPSITLPNERLTSQTSPKLSIQADPDMNGGVFFCDVSDRYGNAVRSKEYVLTVKQRLRLTKDLEPTVVLYAGGGNGYYKIFQIEAVGDGLSYQWYHKKPGDTTYTVWTGETDQRLIYYPSSADNGMKVYCLVKDKWGKKISSSVMTITVRSYAKILQEPVDFFADLGESAKFTVKAEGEELTYQWYYQKSGESSFTLWSGKTASTLSFSVTSGKLNMKVYCEVTDKHGKRAVSKTVTLIPKNALKITKNLENQMGFVGESTRFSIEADGEGLTYQWYYQMAGADNFTTWSGRTSAGFNFTPKKSHDQMKVYCVIKDAYGNKITSNTMTLTVQTRLKITQEPADIAIDPDQSARYELKAQGDGLTYQWYFKLIGQSEFSVWSGKTAAAFTYGNAFKRNGMQAYCVVTDAYGNTVTSRTVRLAVGTIETPLKWTLQPESTEAWYGKHVIMNAEASGEDVTYQWYYKSASAASFKVWSGRTSATLDFVPNETNDQMQIYCQAKDAHGRTITSQVVTLSVKTPVKIKTQPMDISVFEGQNASFSLSAIGDGLTYQWYFKKNGASAFSKWGGRTSASFAYQVTPDKNAMQVYCIVSDQYGNTVQSKTITLTVKSVQVGDYYTFGSYEQDNDTSNGKETIEWLVLDKDGSKVLLISRDALDVVLYDETGSNMTWESCSLRKWLNSTFWNTAFSPAEQAHILSTYVSADQNPDYRTDPGNVTWDHLFMLSILEARHYFSSDELRRCGVSEYARNCLINNTGWDDFYFWWLRTPGRYTTPKLTTGVNEDGSIGSDGYGVVSPLGCIRPAMWIDLNA